MNLGWSFVNLLKWGHVTSTFFFPFLLLVLDGYCDGKEESGKGGGKSEPKK